MKWYRFWKKVRGHECNGTYHEFEDDATEEFIKDECEDWGITTPGGEHRGYSYGFKGKKPPKEYIIQKIKNLKSSIEYKEKELEKFVFLFKTYSVKAKIEKIKII